MPELSLSKQALIELLERASNRLCEPYSDYPCEDDRSDPPIRAIRGSSPCRSARSYRSGSVSTLSRFLREEVTGEPRMPPE